MAGQPAPIPANSVPNLAVESEAQQRRDFPTTDFAFGFETNDVETPAGTQSMLVRLCQTARHGATIAEATAERRAYAWCSL